MAKEQDQKTVVVNVSGRVQGVGYRDWVRRQAALSGLNGWVRNEADGSVAAMLSGPGPQVEELLTAMKAGPRFALVDDVVVRASDDRVPAGFEIRFR